ncbi:MAG: hypothetical protein JWR64_962 [Marmoricola sp.]|nr:hypothetical protein [Marmoricola sp.]
MVLVTGLVVRRPAVEHPRRLLRLVPWSVLLAWGSLADRLWLRACRTRGLPVWSVRFGLEGLLVVPAAVVAAVAAVWLTQASRPTAAGTALGRKP